MCSIDWRNTERIANRRDVLDVLARLDPPEAYAPEIYRERARTASASIAELPKMRRPKLSLLAIVSMSMAAESIGLFALAIIYVGATTAFMLHGIGHWLTRGYRVRDPALITDE